jgi:hypothetical protein
LANETNNWPGHVSCPAVPFPVWPGFPKACPSQLLPGQFLGLWARRTARSHISWLREDTGKTSGEPKGVIGKLVLRTWAYFSFSFHVMPSSQNRTNHMVIGTQRLMTKKLSMKAKKLNQKNSVVVRPSSFNF